MEDGLFPSSTGKTGCENKDRRVVQTRPTRSGSSSAVSESTGLSCLTGSSRLEQHFHHLQIVINYCNMQTFTT